MLQLCIIYFHFDTHCVVLNKTILQGKMASIRFLHKIAFKMQAIVKNIVLHYFTQDKKNLTTLHRSLFKYLTAQDTCGTPTLTKNNRTLARLGNLLCLQPRSTIKVSGFFFCPLYWVNLSKNRYSSELVTKVFSFCFPKTKWNNTVA